MTTPAQPDPATQLRAAARMLRERAAEATPGPWVVNDPAYATEIHGPGGVAVVAGGRWGGEAPAFECDGDAAWIALMHPGVGGALAKMLDDSAHQMDRASALFGGLDAWAFDRPALAVARGLLGGAS